MSTKHHIDYENAVRNKVLGDASPSDVLDATQTGVFSGIFTAFSDEIGDLGRKITFPASGVISMIKGFFATKRYLKNPNRSLTPMLLTASSIATGLGEIAATVFKLTSIVAYSGLAPLILIGILGYNFLTQIAATIHHGLKMVDKFADQKTYTYGYHYHKTQFKKNLRSAFISGVIGATVFIKFPIVFGMSLASGVYYGIKTAAYAIQASIMAQALIQPIKKSFKKHFPNAVKNYVALKEKISSGFQKIRNLFSRHSEDKNPATKENAEAIFPRVPLAGTIAAKALTEEDMMIAEYQHPNHFTTLNFHVDDLLHKLKVTDSKETKANLWNKWVIEQRARIQNGTEQSTGFTKWAKDLFKKYDGETTKAKMDALECLNLLATRSPEEENENRITFRGKPIASIEALIDHLKEIGLHKKVFRSSFETVGNMQKMFLLADSLRRDTHNSHGRNDDLAHEDLNDAASIASTNVSRSSSLSGIDFRRSSFGSDRSLGGSPVQSASPSPILGTSPVQSASPSSMIKSKMPSPQPVKKQRVEFPKLAPSKPIKKIARSQSFSNSIYDGKIGMLFEKEWKSQPPQPYSANKNNRRY